MTGLGRIMVHKRREGRGEANRAGNSHRERERATHGYECIFRNNKQKEHTHLHRSSQMCKDTNGTQA